MRHLLLCLLLLCAQAAPAHSGKALYHIIVDTDGAADDLRTLCLLLGNHDAEVLAVVTSDGALPPVQTARRVAALLRELHHEGIPVGAGRPTANPVPHWRTHSQQIKWGDTTSVNNAFPSAVDLLCETIRGEDAPVTIVALGALTNCNDLRRQQPACFDRLERILWYGGTTPGKEANFRADPDAARQLIAAGRVPVETVAGHRSGSFAVDPPLLDSLAALAAEGNPYARRILTTHRRAPLDSLCRTEHLQLWDDLVALRLHRPELFDCRQQASRLTVATLSDTATRASVRTAIVGLLRERPDAESRVFYGFPTDSEAYAADVRPLIDSAIRRHGRSEWRAAVLTNELHGHLGIYALVGVKMGLRAREYFNIGVDDVEVTSRAGTRPPVSCMNDGLQVGTGGTVGHGLIRAADTPQPQPEATFRFKDRAVRLKLKPEYAERIRREVGRGVALYGTESEAYWQYIRALALRYWLDFDRHEMFEVVSPLS